MSEVNDVIEMVKKLHPLAEGTLGTGSVMLIIDEVDKLRTENERLMLALRDATTALSCILSDEEADMRRNSSAAQTARSGYRKAEAALVASPSEGDPR